MAVAPVIGRSTVLLLLGLHSLWAQSGLPFQHSKSPARALQGAVPQQDTVRPAPLPTEEPVRFTPEQDSAYVRELQSTLPPAARFAAALRASQAQWERLQEQAFPTAWQSALRNLQLRQELLSPDAQELVQYQYALQQAQALPNPTLRRTPGATAAIPLETIARVLGLSEDLSPRIPYEVPSVARVQVLVYSVQALRVATLLDEVQRPGRYEVTWNGRDDHGRALPPGDYVVEVRIGELLRYYKRIQLRSADVR
jgi:hypothetical protein